MCADNSVADTTAPCSGCQRYSPFLHAIPYKFPSKLPHHTLLTCTVLGAFQEFFIHVWAWPLLLLALPMSPQLLWLLQLSHCPEVSLRAKDQGCSPQQLHMSAYIHTYTHKCVCKLNSSKQFLYDILNYTRLG